MTTKPGRVVTCNKSRGLLIFVSFIRFVGYNIEKSTLHHHSLLPVLLSSSKLLILFKPKFRINAQATQSRQCSI